MALCQIFAYIHYTCNRTPNRRLFSAVMLIRGYAWSDWTDNPEKIRYSRSLAFK